MPWSRWDCDLMCVNIRLWSSCNRRPSSPRQNHSHGSSLHLLGCSDLRRGDTVSILTLHVGHRVFRGAGQFVASGSSRRRMGSSINSRTMGHTFNLSMRVVPHRSRTELELLRSKASAWTIDCPRLFIAVARAGFSALLRPGPSPVQSPANFFP